MAGNTIRNLPQQSGKRSNIWADLHLDLQESYLVERELFRPPIINDFKVDKDIEAVKNSIRNIFNTSPGTKILAPEFGLDLRNYLFNPLSEILARSLAEDIYHGLPILDDRLAIEKIVVTLDTEAQAYIIDLQIDVPSLNISGLSVKGLLNNDGYTTI